MKHFWVIFSQSSVSLFYRNYSDFKLDPDLVSGFLSALNYFSESELDSQVILSIEMSGLKWVYSYHQEMGLLLVAACKRSENTEIIFARLQVIYKMFVEKFNLTPEKLSNVIIDQEKYAPFEEVLDELSQQWIQAEKLMTGKGAAHIFDLMLVFQQIYNHFNKIIRKKFHKKDYDDVISEIGMILKNMKESPEFLANPELSKIEFSKHGWSVITLNPMELDEEVLKRTLIMITLHLNNVLKAHMRDYPRFNAYSKGIYKYMIEQFDLLNKLDLVHVLLQMFIQ